MTTNDPAHRDGEGRTTVSISLVNHTHARQPQMKHRPGRTNLLDEIQAGALDPKSDLKTLLRKCVTLGGETGSEQLRTWAALELKGYGPDDELPPYRQAAAPLLLDGFTGNGMVKGQAVPRNMIPDFARDKITTDVPFPQPIAEIDDLLASARRRSEAFVRLGPPGGDTLVTLINHDLAAEAQEPSPYHPRQTVERIYWAVSVTALARIIDVVRTILVELIAEMRAGTPGPNELPSREIADQAVDVAIKGNRNRVVINQIAPHGEGDIARTTTRGAVRESGWRKAMWWLVAVATVVGTAATLWAALR